MLWGRSFRPANKFLAKREAALWAASLILCEVWKNSGIASVRDNDTDLLAHRIDIDGQVAGEGLDSTQTVVD